MNKLMLEILLLKRIARMKKKLVKVADSTGITSDQTVACSQELDRLLNLHMKHFSHKGKSLLISVS